MLARDNILPVEEDRLIGLKGWNSDAAPPRLIGRNPREVARESVDKGIPSGKLLVELDSLSAG